MSMVQEERGGGGGYREEPYSEAGRVDMMGDERGRGGEEMVQWERMGGLPKGDSKIGGRGRAWEEMV